MVHYAKNIVAVGCVYVFGLGKAEVKHVISDVPLQQGPCQSHRGLFSLYYDRGFA